MRKKTFTFLWAVILLLSVAAFTVGLKVYAAAPKAVRSVSVRIGNKSVAKKTYTLEMGRSKNLKVTGSPDKAVKSIRYASKNSKVAAVNSKGKVTAKNKGTAKIQITVTGKNNKKISTWVKIRVTEVAAVNPQPEPNPGSNPNPETSNILIAYFSRVGNTEYPENIDATTSASVVVDRTQQYGTTEYIARMIQQKAGGDLHRIETKEAYSTDFDEVVDQNHKEMQDGILPELKESNLDISAYDTVFIGYPVWATDAPQAVLSFLKEYDLSGKKVIPFCTHDGYGAGSSYRTIAQACPQASVLDGIAIEAKNVSTAENSITDWLASIDIQKTETKETAIKITIGSTVLDGIIYDTALAQEFKDRFPLTVSMGRFGGREYYGGMDFTPVNSGKGQLNFENGDITYCRTNNTMAIFYAQTERPDLTMEVIPIGKVTSDLSVFDTLGSSENITFQLSGDADTGNAGTSTEDETGRNRTLVAYFSATNTTKRLAEFLSDGLQSDLYEIAPAVPYTSADLDYGNTSSRSSMEMNDPNARPEISGSVENMAQYDIVFIGYPIWWGEAPRIISTFLESYDFSGKKVIPFCTSGSSGIGSSASNLHRLADRAEWLSGRRFGSSVSRNDMIEWVNSLGLGIQAQ